MIGHVRQSFKGDTVTESTPKILVFGASRHGSTAGIAERIAQVLRARGFGVSETPTGVDLSAYDVIVLGSAVYAGHWLDEAKSLAARIGETRPRPAVWLFSSGPIGDPPRPEEVPVDVAVIAEATEAREHVVFAGKLDRSKLGFGERAIVMALRAPEGDFRNWAEIEEWANKIAELSRRESD
jgi:menaquinone-dependent protoporphyrinogen oxidase